MCGLRPNVRHIRPIVAWLMPTCAAILRVLQWVFPFGFSSRVFTKTASTASSPIVRGAPTRGSS